MQKRTNAVAVYPEYLADLNTLVCPSNPAGANALELWDQGQTPSSLWSGDGEVIQPFANDGIVQPCEVYEHPYIYFGWLVEQRMTDDKVNPLTGNTNAQDFEINIKALLAKLDSAPEEAIKTTEEDFELPEGTGSGDGKLIYRLREGIERFLITDVNDPASTARAQSEIGVMWDTISDDEAFHFNHVPGGSNVLYLDGHVAFLKLANKYGNTFPMNQGGFVLHEFSHMKYEEEEDDEDDN
ncbi:MAG TPA: hypothetical protein PLI09_24350 [Candidatus Hydrogenedentes bacterium]|nr:hypothetical protein [Candidatus Hydrogenedentota bacterium]